MVDNFDGSVGILCDPTQVSKAVDVDDHQTHVPRLYLFQTEDKEVPI